MDKEVESFFFHIVIVNHNKFVMMTLTPVLRPPTKIKPSPLKFVPSFIKSITSTCDHSLLNTIIAWSFYCKFLLDF